MTKDRLITRAAVDGSTALTIDAEGIEEAGFVKVITQPEYFDEFAEFGVDECYKVPPSETCLDEVVYIPVAFCANPKKYLLSSRGVDVSADDIADFAEDLPEE